jgi:hypothetical protein
MSRFFAGFILSEILRQAQNDTRSEVLLQNDNSEGLRFFDRLRMTVMKGSE